MKLPRLNLENALWMLVLLLALSIRLLNLGTRPLSDYEASGALQALSVFPEGTYIEPVAPGPQPGPVALTGFLFFLLGSSNGLARFLPALAGTLLCFTPYFLRLRLGRLAALIMAFGLAFDPGLVAVSRLAGGPMPAIGFGLFGLGLLAGQHVVWAGISLGLALLSGPAAIYGIIVLGFTWLIARFLEIPGWIRAEEPLLLFSDRKTIIWLVSAIVGTVLLVGTLFGYFPQGLGAWISALPAFVSGWITPSSIPAGRLLSVLMFYASLALLFGVVGLVISWIRKASLYQRLSIWALVSLMLALLYPGRQLADLVWVVVPLWGLAAYFLSEFLPVPRDQRGLVAVQAVVVFVLMAIVGVNLTGFNQPVPVPQQEALRWLVLAGVLILAVLTSLLVGIGWSWEAGVRGLVWGVTGALLLYGLSGLWSSTQPAHNQTSAIWNPAPLVGDADLLQKTIEDLSTWSTGRKENIAILAAVDSPSLRWLLRRYPNASFTPDRQKFSSEESVPIVITRKTEEDPTLAANYRGQDFAWWVHPEWTGALPANFPVWMVYRDMPELVEEIILWGRADLFPGVAQGQEQQPESPNAPENPDNEPLK